MRLPCVFPILLALSGAASAQDSIPAHCQRSVLSQSSIIKIDYVVIGDSGEQVRQSVVGSFSAPTEFATVQPAPGWRFLTVTISDGVTVPPVSFGGEYVPQVICVFPAPGVKFAPKPIPTSRIFPGSF